MLSPRWQSSRIALALLIVREVPPPPEEDESRGSSLDTAWIYLSARVDGLVEEDEEGPRRGRTPDDLHDAGEHFVGYPSFSKSCDPVVGVLEQIRGDVRQKKCIIRLKMDDNKSNI